MKKLVAFALFVFIVVYGLAIILGNVKNDQNVTSPTPVSDNSGNIQTTITPGKINNPPGPTSVPVKTYTVINVSAHNNASSCWFIVAGKVYDLTSYPNNHPGSAQAILSYCGKDATRAYETQGGQGSHSNRADKALAGFYIGELAK